MGHHIDSEGRFQSDKYPDLPPDRIVLSFHDSRARSALRALIKAYRDVPGDALADDIEARLHKLPLMGDPGEHDAEAERAAIVAYIELEAARMERCTNVERGEVGLVRALATLITEVAHLEPADGGGK